MQIQRRETLVKFLMRLRARQGTSNLRKLSDLISCCPGTTCEQLARKSESASRLVLDVSSEADLRLVFVPLDPISVTAADIDSGRVNYRLARSRRTTRTA